MQKMKSLANLELSQIEIFLFQEQWHIGQNWSGYFWLFLGTDRGPQEPQIFDLRSLGMGKMDLQGGVGSSSNLGRQDMILTT